MEAFQRLHGLTPGRTALFLGGVDRGQGNRLPVGVRASGGAACCRGSSFWSVAPATTSRRCRRLKPRAHRSARWAGSTATEKALALRAADVLAIPSSIGLVAVDSLVSGRPIVTRDNATHGPEADYVRDGLGCVAGWGCHTPSSTPAALVDTLGHPSRLAAMQIACRAEAPRYSLDHMVDAFVEGVLAWDDVRRAGL